MSTTFCASLNEVKGGSTEEVHRLDSGCSYSVGRNRDTVDIVMEHPSVSRVHATFTLSEQGRLMLLDKGSAHGTFLDGSRVAANEETLVQLGQAVRMGASSRTFVLSKVERVGASAPPAAIASSSAGHAPAATSSADPRELVAAAGGGAGEGGLFNASVSGYDENIARGLLFILNNYSFSGETGGGGGTTIAGSGAGTGKASSGAKDGGNKGGAAGGGGGGGGGGTPGSAEMCFRRPDGFVRLGSVISHSTIRHNKVTMTKALRLLDSDPHAQFKVMVEGDIAYVRTAQPLRHAQVRAKDERRSGRVLEEVSVVQGDNVVRFSGLQAGGAAEGGTGVEDVPPPAGVPIPSVLYHGTSFRSLNAIRNTGLSSSTAAAGGDEACILLSETNPFNSAGKAETELMHSVPTGKVEIIVMLDAAALVRDTGARFFRDMNSGSIVTQSAVPIAFYLMAWTAKSGGKAVIISPAEISAHVAGDQQRLDKAAAEEGRKAAADAAEVERLRKKADFKVLRDAQRERERLRAASIEEAGGEGGGLGADDDDERLFYQPEDEAPHVSSDRAINAPLPGASGGGGYRHVKIVREVEDPGENPYLAVSKEEKKTSKMGTHKRRKLLDM